MTKELLKAEIDHIPLKDIETVYRIVKVFTISTDDNVSQDAEKTSPDDVCDVDSKHRFSFIGIGHSGKRYLSTQVEDILTHAANRREGWSVDA